MIPFKSNRCAWKWNTSRLHGILILFFKKNSEHLGLSLKFTVNLNPRNNFYVFEHRFCNELMLVRWSQEILEPTPRMCFCFYSRKTSHSRPTVEHVLEAGNITMSHSTKQWRASKNMHWLSRKNILHYLSSFERDFILTVVSKIQIQRLYLNAKVLRF